MAGFSALKNKGKASKAGKSAKKAAPAKKSVAKKAPAKKAVAKKAPAKKIAPAKKPIKVEVKKELNAKEVQQLVDLKRLIARHNEIVAELAASGIDNYRKAVKKEFMALAQEARALDVEIPVATEKARKAGLGSPSRILSKAQLALIAPKEEAKPAGAQGATKTGKAAVVLDEDGNEVVVEEVELEDVETLIAEVAEIIDAEADGKDQPRVVTLTDDAKNEEGSFVLLDSDAEEEEEDKNEREKHKKDLKNVNLVLEAINGKIQGAVVPPKHNIDQAEAKALTFKQIQQQFAMNTFNEKSAKLIAEAINQGYLKNLEDLQYFFNEQAKFIQTEIKRLPPEQTVLTAGATADPVKDYLKQIGRVALLNAELEVELATRVEAGLFAEEKLKIEKKISKLGTGMLLVSQGIPFIHAGQEYLRSKDFNHNSYNATDAINSLKYSNRLTYASNVDYLKGLVALRKAHKAFRMTTAQNILDRLEFLDGTFGQIGYKINGKAAGDSWSSIVVLANSNPKAKATFNVPKGVYKVVVEGDKAGTRTLRTITVTGKSTGKVTVPGLSMMVLWK